MKQRVRGLPVERKRALLAAAVRVFERDAHITRGAVAREAGVSPGLVSHYLGNVREIRRAVFIARGAGANRQAPSSL